jgi:ABC-type transport system involved in cytochrome c biogenesis permease subunit
MLARLLAVVSSHPGLIFDHIENYAGLVQSEAREYKRVVIKRLITTAIFSVATFACVLLVAISLMLWAVNQNQLWVLVAVPFVFGIISVGAYASMSDKSDAPPFSNIRAQALADARMLKQAARIP